MTGALPHLRRLAALRLFGAVLAVLMVLAPRHGLALAPAEGGLTVVICGAGGSYTVTLPSGVDPAPEPPPLCCLAAGSLAPVVAAPLSPGPPAAVVDVLHAPPRLSEPLPRRIAAHRPRAPPVL